MTHKISEYSQLGGSLAAQPHSGIPITQIEAKDSWEDILLPLQQQYGVGQQVTFEAPQTSQYTDLSKSYVRIQGNWQQAIGGGVCTEDDLTCPVVNFPSALFSQTQAIFNGVQVSPNKGGDQYISFVDRLVLGRRGAFQNAIQMCPSYNLAAGDLNIYDFDQGFSLDQLDTANYANEYPQALSGVNSVPDGSARNFGAELRANRVLTDIAYTNGAPNTGLSEYIYQPVLGAWKIDKLLPDLVKIRLQLTIADPQFYTFTETAAGGGNTWVFVISKMELVLHRIRMSAETIQQNAEAMLVRPWVAPTHLMEYSSQAFQIGAGLTSIPVSLSNMYSGARPKFVLVGIQDYLCTTNSSDYNPYYMTEGGVATADKNCCATQIQLFVNSKPYPLNRPYQPSSPVAHVRDYRALAEVNIDGFPAHSSALINYMQYCLNYTWYVFLLSPEEGDLDTYSPTEDVVIDVQATLQSFSGANLLNGNAICHLIAYVPAVMKVDASRNVRLESKSGVPIQYQ